MSVPRTNCMVVLAALALSSAAAGCDKEGVDQKARELEHVKKDLRRANENLKLTVQEQAERAKAGVAQLHEKLPALKQDAREGLEQAKDGVLHTGDKIVETVKDTLHGASDKVDQTVERAKRAGD